ncbi:MAG: cytochrome C oxidase subunit IV family protein [Bryobacteraceae bacterium]|jgi:cytochrome c oxidase subunit 4|nr:cytochrome C oxidase subunit IV family protein [Bryobacteraceae bacterium]
MSSHAHSHENDWKIYLGVLLALLTLTVITVGASRIDFGSLNVIIAVVIATVKASLVALFFMHLRHDKAINSLIFLSSLMFLSFLLILCLIDVGSRIEPKPANWKGPDKGLMSPRDLDKPATPAGTAPGMAPAPATEAPKPAAPAH